MADAAALEGEAARISPAELAEVEGADDVGKGAVAQQVHVAAGGAMAKAPPDMRTAGASEACEADLTRLKGIGQARLKALEAAELRTVADLAALESWSAAEVDAFAVQHGLPKLSLKKWLVEACELCGREHSAVP